MFQAEFFQFIQFNNSNLYKFTSSWCLPAVDVLTVWDSLSEIGGKKTALKVVEKGFAENLLQFGKQPLSEAIVSNAQYYFVKC